MVFLILGGSASGKSAWAEALAVALFERGKRTGSENDVPKDGSGEEARGPLLYLATMEAGDPESLRRVARHREQRAGKGFLTLERSHALSGLILPPGATVLLEDLGNLAAGELFAPGGGGAKALEAGVRALIGSAQNLVVVGNSVFGDGEEYRGMEEYLSALSRVQNLCGDLADGVAEVVCGVPLWQKRPDSGWFRRWEQEERIF